MIYLTPKGYLPTDINGKYQDGWCIMSYSEIIKTLRTRLSTDKSLKIKQYAKLKFLIEDYINMVDNKILNNNPTIRTLCKQIRCEHADALEILMNYTDNVKDVYNYITKEWLPLKVPQTAQLIADERKLIFFTPTILDFYSRHGQIMKVDGEIFRFQISVSSKDDAISIVMWLSKKPEDEWTAADIKIRDILQPEKKNHEISSTKYCTLYSLELLNSEERQQNFYNNDNTLVKKLENKLNDFLIILQRLECALQNL